MASNGLEPVIKGVRMGQSRFIYGLEQVPDDRLSWRPTADAPSALELGAKLAGFMHFVIHYVKTGERAQTPGEPPITRDEVIAALREGFDSMVTGLAGMTAEDLGRKLMAPWGVEVPAAQMAGMVPGIVAYFQGQLNYLQLCYGDKDPNIPPNWGVD
jgi:hypothetical protein